MLVVCTSCSSKIRVPDTAAGKRVKCPKCAAVVQVPLEEPTLAPAPVEDNPFTEMEPPAAPVKTRARAEDDEEDEAPPPRRRRRDADDDDDLGPRGNSGGSDKKTLSIASLVCGILGFCCCPAGIAAIVLGMMAKNSEPNAKGLWLTGIILGGVSIFLNIVGNAMYFLVLNRH